MIFEKILNKTIDYACAKIDILIWKKKLMKPVLSMQLPVWLEKIIQIA